MRILYFDLDGTILSSKNGEPKKNLRKSGLELAVRRAGFTHLVCVGNIGIIAGTIAEQGIEYDALEVVFQLCGGAFEDIDWFRSVTSMVPDPEKRAEFIDYSSDWWYMDDLAEHYLHEAGRWEKLTGCGGHRVFVPNPGGNGTGMLDWLNSIAS